MTTQTSPPELTSYDEPAAHMAIWPPVKRRRFTRWQAALLYLVLIGLGIAIALPWGEVVWAWLGMKGGGR